MSSGTAPPTLRALVARRDFALRVVVGDAGLDRELSGVHSSDLADPTPFLLDDLLLLTTGRQFGGWADEDRGYDEYVARLDARGVAGLGFGTDVVRAGIPTGLADACARHGLPLVEVPYATPFIALAGANAEALAAQAYARQTWALQAHHALALAALEADGISATLDELARQLGGWAGLYDPSAVLMREHPRGLLDRPSRAAVAARAGDLLRRGTAGAAALSATVAADPIPPFAVSVQTLGHGGHLRGALAVAAPALDHAGRAILTSAVGMLGLALEQGHALDRAQSRLRAGLMRALLAGESDLVADVASAVWDDIPAPPVVVGFVTGAAAMLTQAADVLARHAGPSFFGPVDDGLVVVTPAGDRSAIDVIADALPLRIGLSRPTEAASAASLDQARTAASGVRGDAGVAHFDDVARSDLLAADGAAARALATERLAPLDAHDVAYDTALITTLRAWFEADCRNEQAANELGVHRHTVRARLAHIERLLGRDLGSFAVRAELWTALKLAR